MFPVTAAPSSRRDLEEVDVKRTDRELAEELALRYLETLSDEELEASVGGIPLLFGGTPFFVTRHSFYISEAVA